MTIDKAIGLLKMAVPMKAVTMAEFNDFIEAVNMAIDALENLLSASPELSNNSPKLDNENGELISRQAAIDVEGLDEQIRCEMCRNPIHTNRGCDGNCKYDEKLYERIMQILGERIKPLPSAQPDLSEYSDKLWRNAYERGKRDAQPERKRGEWTNDNSCQFCRFQPWFEKDIHTLSFCPNCGADMRGECNE